MMNAIIRTVYAWLYEQKLPVASKHIEKKLLEHPAFPSLLSITDMLDQLGITNTALVVDKDRFQDIPTPFLAHVDTKGGDFILITDRNRNKSSIQAKLNYWSGIVLVAEKSGFKNNADNSLEYRKQRKTEVILFLLLSLFMLLSFSSLLFVFSWTALVSLLLSLTGLFLSLLMARKERGFSNGQMDKLCDWAASNGCDQVLKKEKRGILRWLSLVDLSLIWFATVSVFLPLSVTAGIYSGSALLITTFAAASLPLLIYAVWYQRFVAKTWCTICLFIAVLVVSQAVSGLFFPGNWKSDITEPLIVKSALFFFLTAALITTGWYIIRRVLQSADANKEEYYELKRFKNNPGIFSYLLTNQKKINGSRLPGDIVFGNTGSPLQLIMACSPYCNPCARAHKKTDALLEYMDLGLAIRFVVHTKERESPKTKAAAYLLSLLQQSDETEKRQILLDWYADMDMEKFKAIHPVSISENAWNVLKENEHWARNTEIDATPTFFINSYKMPTHYNIADLPMLIINNSVADNSLFKIEHQQS